MICPHCQEERRQRERTGHVCSFCHMEFALDPRVEPGRLHDTKFRRLVAKAAPDGLRITVEQVYWANERRLYRFPDAEEHQGSLGGGVTLLVVAVILGSLAVGIGGFAYVLPGLPAAVAGLLAVKQFRGLRRLKADVPMTPGMPQSTFEQQVIARWRKVYGTLPDGLVEHPPAASAHTTVKARAVVLCELPPVTAFLRANGFAERHGVLLVDSPSKVPSGLPVVVPRDLSLTALARSATLRKTLPGHRVVDCGLLPRAVFAPAKAVRLRPRYNPKLPVPAVLATAPGWQRLTPRERDWLTAAWSTPLISLPPAKLLAVIEKAVGRALTPPPAAPLPSAAGPVAVPAVESAAETRRRAERIGFLTWPAAVPAPRTGVDAPSGATATRPAPSAPPAPPARPTDSGR